MKQQSHKIPDHNILDLRSHTFVTRTTPENILPKREGGFLKTHERQKPIPSFLNRTVDVPQPPELIPHERIRFKSKWKLPKISFTLSLRPIAVFTLLLLFIVVGFTSVSVFNQVKAREGKVLGATTTAFEFLDGAQRSLLANDRASARTALLSAQDSFTVALNEIASVHESYGLFITLSGKKDELISGEKALLAGRSIAQVGLLADDFLHTAEVDGTKTGYVGFMDAYKQYGHPIRRELETAHGLLSEITLQDIPESYRPRVEQATTQFNRLYDGLRKTDELLTIFSDVLGFNGPRSHLLIFQNNQELRATGGFIGSVAHISITDGQIKGLYVPKGGSYDISGQVQAQVKAPKPLQIINPYFSFQDANWFANFETSAKKILAMYENAGNEPVDGIIAFTPDVVLRLLGLTGPITLSDTVSVEITQENFLKVLRDSIEREKQDASNEPKKIIAELLPSLLNAAMNLPFTQQLSFALALEESLSKKDVLLYSTDSYLQSQISTSGFEGNLQNSDIADDYISLISSNIAGGKTDRDIIQHITIHSELSETQVINTVTIKRSHNGIPYDPYSGTVNLTYDRFYTPLGSTFANAIGFYKVPITLFQEPPNLTPLDSDLVDEEVRTIVQEATGTRILENEGKMIFGNWTRVEPEHTTETQLSYTRNVMPTGSWSMYFERQPGGHLTYVTWIVDTTNPIIENKISTTGSAHTEGTHAEFSFELATDVLAGVIF